MRAIFSEIRAVKIFLSNVVPSMVAMCCVLFLSTLHAEESKGKVAVLDLERAVMTTDVAREKIKTFESQKDYVEMQNKIEALQKDAAKKSADAQKESPTWSADQLANYRKEMDFIQKDLQLADQKMRAQYGDIIGGIMKDMDQKIKTAVNECIAEEKITVLLKREAVFVAIPEVDITAKVTAKLNKAK